VLGTYGLFQDVLGYELSCAERYRRFVSLVMIRGASADSPARRILSDRIRSSDLLAEKNSHLVILMSETNRNGAAIAIDRYREFCAEHPLWFSSVTFPQDTGSAAELVRAGERRLDLACKDQPGAVVVTD
jgi:hypothetical protein